MSLGPEIYGKTLNVSLAIPSNLGTVFFYQFIVDVGALESIRSSLELAVERPWLYEITLNGNPVDYGSAERWFDPEIRKASISSAVRGGTNTIVVKAQPMRPLCEIMPVYVLGDFTIESAENQFRLDQARELRLG